MEEKAIQEPGGWGGGGVFGWIGQIRFYNPLWLSSEHSFDSESKFEPSVAKIN